MSAAAVRGRGGGGKDNSEGPTRPQRAMEIMDSSEPFLHWDRNLSELSEAGEIDCVLNTTVSDRLIIKGTGKVKEGFN